MFTPQEVSEKVFPKASFGGGGYNMASVDEFLDALTEDYTALFKENVTLKAKLKVLAEKVEEYRSTEEAMRQALLTAQKMAAKLVQEAQSEKEKILADAQVEAQTEIHRLDDERRAAEKKLQAAQEKTAAFIRRSEELCQAQSAFLQSLPEVVVTLSGMSNLEQLQDNLNTYKEEKPLDPQETAVRSSRSPLPLSPRPMWCPPSSRISSASTLTRRRRRAPGAPSPTSPPSSCRRWTAAPSPAISG